MSRLFQIFMIFLFLISLSNLYADVDRSSRDRERNAEKKGIKEVTLPFKISTKVNPEDLCKPGTFKVKKVDKNLKKGEKTGRTPNNNILLNSSFVEGLESTKSGLLTSFIESYDHSFNDYTVSSDVCESHGNGFLICGGTAQDYENKTNTPSAYLLWIDNSGNPVREETYTISGSNSCVAFGVCQAEGNCYYITGAYDLYATPTPKGFLMKIDGIGNIIDVPSTFSNGYGLGVISSIDGGCILSGMRMIDDVNEPARVFVKKFDDALDEVWTWNQTKNSPLSQAEFNETWTYVNCLMEVDQGFDGEGNVVFGYTHNDGVKDCSENPFLSALLVCLDKESGRLECSFNWGPKSDPGGGIQ